MHASIHAVAHLHVAPYLLQLQPFSYQLLPYPLRLSLHPLMPLMLTAFTQHWLHHAVAGAPACIHMMGDMRRTQGRRQLTPLYQNCELHTLYWTYTLIN